MRVITAQQDTMIQLGAQGEHLATRVQFNIEDWIKGFGSNGAAQILALRPMDEDAYLVEQAFTDGNLLVWDVQELDLLDPGEGKCEIQYLIDNAVVKSETFRTFIRNSVGQAGSLIYDGTYEIQAEIGDDIVIPVKNKYLTDEIVIKPVPYAEVSNDSGGLTITIGG